MDAALVRLVRNTSRKIVPNGIRTKISKYRYPFLGWEQYWESRYASGGNSGAGSYNDLAILKAAVVNEFVQTNAVEKGIEFGCGDGNQLKLASYPSYIGFDVSKTAVEVCRTLFKADGSKSFHLMDEYSAETATLVLSLDVIYHLVEDEVYENYMRTLFNASKKDVIIYPSDSEQGIPPGAKHIKFRHFTGYVKKNFPKWRLAQRMPNRYPFHYEDGKESGSRSEFFFYERD